MTKLSRNYALLVTGWICCSQANCLGSAVDSLFKSEVLKGELGVLMKNTLPLEEVIILGVIAEGRFSVILAPEEYHTRLHLRCLWKRESLLQNVLTAVCHLQVSIQSTKYECYCGWWYCQWINTSDKTFSRKESFRKIQFNS